jgi:hypothetical protein
MTFEQSNFVYAFPVALVSQEDRDVFTAIAAHWDQVAFEAKIATEVASLSRMGSALVRRVYGSDRLAYETDRLARIRGGLRAARAAFVVRGIDPDAVPDLPIGPRWRVNWPRLVAVAV